MTNSDSNFTELKRLFEVECELIERKYADERKPVSIARQYAAKARVLSMMLDGLSIETAMGRAEFAKSKQAVLGFVSQLIGVPPKQITDHAKEIA